MQVTLITYESRLEQLFSLTNSFQLQANIVSGNTKNRNTNTNSNTTFWRGHNHNNRGGRASRGRGQNGRGNNPPVCQVCGKIRHTATDCYFRYDQAYMGSFPSSGNPNSTITNSNNSTVAQLAYVASANTIVDPSWYIDSGVNAHITNNSANLDHTTNAYGKEEVIVGNGEKLIVKNTGVTSMPSKHQSLRLRDVFHAPQVTKNLISVLKSTSNNDILIEFDSCGCYVKEKSMGKLLLKGNLKDDLYEFQGQGSSQQRCLTI